MKLPKSSVDRVRGAFANLDLGDPRRLDRVLRTVENLALKPGVSFPEAMGSEADIEGGYRLMSSPRVTMAQLNASHARVTGNRARSCGRVLAIHDTTRFEFAHADPKEVGYLPTGAPGFFGHYTLVVERESRRPLGVAHVEIISRSRRPRKRVTKTTTRRTRSGSETVKDTERESLKWQRGFAEAQSVLADADVLHVADREGDNYDLFAQAVAQGQHFVIRARLMARRVEGGGESDTLRTIVDGARGVLTREVDLAPRKVSTVPRRTHAERAARKATLTFAAARVEIVRPRFQPKTLPESLELNVVRVFEANPPANEEPVEWVLLTTEPVATEEDVAAIVDAYRARWLIEECNKALKTGCRYEDRQFESLHALETLLAMTFPIACELLWLRACCRRKPNMPAAEVLTRVQLQILVAIASRPMPPEPTARDALLAIAALGGHMKTNGEPGWLILHRGMAKLLAYEEGWAVRERVGGLSISR